MSSIPPSPDEDLVSSANLGAALRGLLIGLNPSPIVMQTNGQILAMPPLFPMVLGSTEVKMHSFGFSTENSASAFQKTSDAVGISLACELDAAVDSSIQQNNNLSDCLVRLICHQFLVASFNLNRSEMTFTAIAIEQLGAIRNLTEAVEFMLRFGSHISTGGFQFGGILWHHVHVTTEKPVAPEELEELATKWLNAGVPLSVTTSLPIRLMPP